MSEVTAIYGRACEQETVRRSRLRQPCAWCHRELATDPHRIELDGHIFCNVECGTEYAMYIYGDSDFQI